MDSAIPPQARLGASPLPEEPSPMALGKPLRLELVHFAAGGYHWHLESLPAFLSASWRDLPGAGGGLGASAAVGGSGPKSELSLVPIAQGEGEVVLRLRRPWDVSDVAEERRLLLSCP